LAFSPTSPLWVADNGSGVSTLYSITPGGAAAKKVGLTVILPGDTPAPTGQVFNGTTGFVVTTSAGSGAAPFIFSSESGHIYAWNPAADPVVNGVSTATTVHTSPTAVYKGLAIGNVGSRTFLYASNFHDNRVEVFDSKFHRAHLFGSFRDGALPRG